MRYESRKMVRGIRPKITLKYSTNILQFEPDKNQGQTISTRFENTRNKSFLII